MKVLKKIAFVLKIIILIDIIFILGVFVYNRIMLIKEKSITTAPLGQMVEIDGNNMCVYTEGEGEHTLVFMSGWGVASPILDFRSLYNHLDDEYRIVVVEKFGYGYSDIIKDERSFDTMLKQDREAISKAGIDGPVILCPHSLSGLEALLWAQEYPDEVEAIVGFDMSLPMDGTKEIARGLEDSCDKTWLLCKSGLLRLINIDNMIEAFKTGVLTDEEKEIYRALSFAKMNNITVKNEVADMPATAERIDKTDMPDIPMLLFSMKSKEEQQTYAVDRYKAKVIPVDCGHFVHNAIPDEASKEMKDFIKNLNK